MEALFMQAFELRDSVEAQMRQQAGFYSQTLACALLAAGHRPPPWLLPAPADVANFEGRERAEAPVGQQAAPDSQPPAGLLPGERCSSATVEGLLMSVFERRESVEAQMLRQVVSYSETLACAHLAAGHQPPPWLLAPHVAVPMQDNTVSKPSIEPSNPKSTDSVHHALPETDFRVNHKMLEAVSVKPGNHLRKPSLDLTNPVDGVHHALANTLERTHLNISNCSATVDQCQKCISATVVIESAGMHYFSDNPSYTNAPEALPETNALEVSDTPSNLPLQNDTLQSVETDFLEGVVVSTLHENDATWTADDVSFEVPHYENSVSLEKETLLSDEANFLEGPLSMAALLLEKGITSTDCLEGPHLMASSPLEKVTLHCARNDFIEGRCSVPSLLLDKEARHTSETNFPEEPFCLASPKLVKDWLHSIEHAGELEKSSPLDMCINGHYRIIEQQRSECHLLSTPINESALPPSQLDDTTFEAYDACIWDNLGVSVRPEVLSSASSESARGLHTAERNCTVSKEKCFRNLLHDGTEQHICFPENASEISPSFCASATDKQTKSASPSVPHFLHSSGSGDKFYSRKSEIQNTAVDSDKLCVSGIKIQQLSSCERVTMNCQSDDVLCFSSSTMSTSSSLDSQDDIHDQMSDKQTKSSRPSAQHFYHPGSGEKISSLKLGVQRTASQSGKLGASGIQEQRNSSSERVVVYRQSDDVLYGSSSTMSTSSSLDSQDDIHEKMETGANFLEKPQTLARYFLSGSVSEEHISLSFEGRSNASAWMSPVAYQVEAAEDSFSERNMGSFSDVHFNSPITKASLCGGSTGNTKVAMLPQYPQSYSLRNGFEKVFISSSSFVDISSDNDECYRREAYSCIKYTDAGGEIATTKDQALTPIACVESGTEAVNLEAKNYPDTTSTTFARYAVDEQLLQACASDESVQEKLGYDSKLDLEEKGIEDDLIGQPISDGAIANEDDDNRANFAETMRECQSFSTPIPSNSPTIEERALEAYCESTKFLNKWSDLITKYNLKPPSAVQQSLPDRFEKLMKKFSTYSVDHTHHDPGYDTNANEDDGNRANFAETMQECQSFSTPIPSNSPTIEERALEAYCESTKFLNKWSDLITKYNLKPPSAVQQSLPDRFEKLMKKFSTYSVDHTHHDPGFDTNGFRISGKYSLDPDGGCSISDFLAYDFSNANSVQEHSENPLTPSVAKSSMENFSRRTGSSSDCLGSIPELSCFRIDEGSVIAEENENQGKSRAFLSRSFSSQGLARKKSLTCATSLYPRREKAGFWSRTVDVATLDLKARKSYTMEHDHHLRLRINQAMCNPKEKCASSIRKKGKVTQPLHDTLNRTRILGGKSERYQKEAPIEKGCRPSNIVTNMTTFMSLKKEKQRPTTSCGKRNVRVKALEVAQVTKRREEKKQKEREIRKAAVERERGRLKLEKEHKQKQVEQKKKRDADIISRKRQSEDDEKENKRKKKCLEEAHKQQKQLVEISRFGTRDTCPEDTNGMDHESNLVMKHQAKSDERTESVREIVASANYILKATAANGKFEGYGPQVSLPDDCDKSYEMSPYEDSDGEEDYDDLEHKVEMRRRRKFKPLWTQEEILYKILQSNQTLDPSRVFARKCSSILSDAG
ncbi:hypothetical protein ACP70R_017680 [Stipagrostis hirtigluma subsp. patula]